MDDQVVTKLLEEYEAELRKIFMTFGELEARMLFELQEVGLPHVVAGYKLYAIREKTMKQIDEDPEGFLKEGMG